MRQHPQDSADPTWIDRGEERERVRVYWQSYAFGESTTSAAMRPEVLASLPAKRPPKIT